MREFTICLLLAFSASQPCDALSFEVKVSGTPGKPAMILIPGLSSAGEVWDSTVERYGKRYECHVLTLAGFAGVPLVNKEEGMLARVRNDLAAYIREKKLQRPVLVGHSLGGFMALWLASQEPALVGSLVIVDALPNLGGLFGQGGNPKAMRDMIANQSKEDYEKYIASGAGLRGMTQSASHMEVIKGWSMKSDRWAVANGMYDLMTTNLEDELPRIKSRVIVLGSWIGMKAYTDRATVEGNFKKQYTKLAGYRLELADKAQHFIMYDDPEWYFTQVDRFLAEEGAKPSKTRP